MRSPLVRQRARNPALVPTQKAIMYYLLAATAIDDKNSNEMLPCHPVTHTMSPCTKTSPMTLSSCLSSIPRRAPSCSLHLWSSGRVAPMGLVQYCVSSIVPEPLFVSLSAGPRIGTSCHTHPAAGLSYFSLFQIWSHSRKALVVQLGSSKLEDTRSAAFPIKSLASR
jgi:hypothetical protein